MNNLSGHPFVSRFFPALSAVLALATGAVSLSSAAAPAVDIPLPEIPFTKYTLPNGLRLVVSEDHNAPIVAVSVWYHVGSKNEKPGKTGFAHLFEHLMFNGSENYDDDWFKMMNKLGATGLNGTTNSDRTNYFQTVPSTALDSVLWMESDRMGHLLGAITQAKLDEQRGVVQNEKRRGDNQPYGMTRYAIAEYTYPKGHPYSWETIGSMEDLNAASLDDVREWFKGYYGAANAVLIVVGDVKAEDVKQRVEKFFGDIPAGPPITRPQTWVAKRSGYSRAIMEDRVPQGRLTLVWNTPEAYQPDDIRLDVAGNALGGGRSSRLYKRFVLGEQSVSAIRAGQSSGEIGSQFTITATLKPGADPAKVEDGIRDEVSKFLASGPTADELSLAQVETLSGQLRAAEAIGGFGGKSGILAESEVYHGKPDAYKDALAMLKATTTDDVKAAANAWLADGLFTLEVRPLPSYTASATGAERSKDGPPAAEAPAAPIFPQIQRQKLKNGAELLLVERKGSPLITTRIVIDGGASLIDQKLPAGTAALTAELLDEATATRDAAQISDDLSRIGANLNAGAAADRMSINLSAIKTALPQSLAILADVLLHPAFKQEDIDRLKQRQLVGIRQTLAQPEAATGRVLAKLLYGEGHPYATPTAGTGGSVGKITREDILKGYAVGFAPNTAHIIVVGDITLADAAAQLETALADWKPLPAGDVAEFKIPAVSEAKADKKVIYLIDRPGAPQSHIAAAQLADPRTADNDIVYTMANFILGGQFTSRINMNLREDKHWSYGARTGFTGSRGPRLFTVSAPVQSDKTKESMIEIMKELKAVESDHPITTPEADSAKSGIVLSLPGRWETAGAVASSVEDIVALGFPERYYDSYPAKVRETAPEALTSAARFINPETLTWVIAGDRAKIEPGLKELGWGEVRVIDSEGNVKP